MDPDLTVVLLGSSGVGKSAAGNTILGRQAFECGQAFRSVTTQICEATGTVFGIRVCVVDTPGIFGCEDEVRARCQRVLRSSGACLFLVVFSVGRFTKEQGKVLMAVNRVLGPHEFTNCFLLFTGGDALKGVSLEDFIYEDEASSLRPTFSGRFHLFNNEDGGREQVRELLEKAGHLRTQRRPGSPDRTIVLLGLPGGGKSSSGNTILGSDQFRSVGGFDSVSTETVWKSAEVEGRWLTVVDTPGLTEDAPTPERLCDEVRTAAPGPHAFVIVVRIGSVSKADVRLLETLPQACGASVVLFTHGDELRGQSVSGLIQSSTHVSDLVSRCGGRFCVFDNTNRGNREQVRNLLDAVDEMLMAAQSASEDTVWRKMIGCLKAHKYKVVCVSLCVTALTSLAVVWSLNLI